jgi:hypothetical protein
MGAASHQQDDQGGKGKTDDNRTDATDPVREEEKH